MVGIFIVFLFIYVISIYVFVFLFVFIGLVFIIIGMWLFIMFGKWGIMGYVVFLVIIWGLVIDFFFGKLKYLMNFMYVYKCI